MTSFISLPSLHVVSIIFWAMTRQLFFLATMLKPVLIAAGPTAYIPIGLSIRFGWYCAWRKSTGRAMLSSIGNRSRQSGPAFTFLLHTRVSQLARARATTTLYFLAINSCSRAWAQRRIRFSDRARFQRSNRALWELNWRLEGEASCRCSHFLTVRLHFSTSSVDVPSNTHPRGPS